MFEYRIVDEGSFEWMQEYKPEDDHDALLTQELEKFSEEGWEFVQRNAGKLFFKKRKSGVIRA